MNNLTHLKSTFSNIDPNDSNANKELSKSIEISTLNNSLDTTEASERLHLPEKPYLSDYEDDDEDSGFCCPCCLPR